MCVTAGVANISDTETYVYATDLGDGPVHVCGYQNRAQTLTGGNAMFLNFAGSNLRVVRGPENTRNFMRAMTYRLPTLAPSLRSRGMIPKGGPSIRVEQYGDYDLVLAQGPGDILSALGQVSPQRRPADTRSLREMIGFYMSFYPEDSFVLACWDGVAKPTHPITVSYRPRNASVLTIPGLDGHDGRTPVIGAPVMRNFHVAFALQEVKLPLEVRYGQEGITGQPWAPASVTGFVDNRPAGPNGDYIIPVKAVRKGLLGANLAKHLVTP